MTHRPADMLRHLSALSARIGGDPALVQAAGGNTSLKHDGRMWIKASGTWLAHATARDIMVPVSLAPLLDALASDAPFAESCTDFVDRSLASGGLRPSIETTMHAVLGEPVVLHVHCVNTIAWAVRADAEARLAPLLAGLAWTFVPYRRPGLPLTRAILECRRPETRVLVLGKHGLVVTGPTVEDAEALLVEVVARLKRPARPAPIADLARLAALAGATPYRPAALEAAHGVALDKLSLAAASAGSLYPDHVVFLGRGVHVLADEDITPALAAAGAWGAPPKLVLAPGEGAFVLRDSAEAVDPMVRCLADVTARLTPDDPIAPLTADDEDALLNWDAEHYRQSLTRAAGAERARR
jgi:rhamnose utilization protein RhaD (predicted bifunctional aldolase and dehydrogenase)